MHNDNRLVDIMRSIKEIDKEHNGYVTVTELDDIIKLHYKNQLANYSLKQIFRSFASIQNKVLIDYKQFRDFVSSGLTEK